MKEIIVIMILVRALDLYNVNTAFTNSRREFNNERKRFKLLILKKASEKHLLQKIWKIARIGTEVVVS